MDEIRSHASRPERYDRARGPVRLGPVALRNRIVSTSHQTTLVHDHLPTDDLVAYHEARAAGGIGAIFLEATAVHPTGLLTGHTLAGYLPGIVPGYRRLADAVHRHGAKLFTQLFHGGREQIGSAPQSPAVAPSAVPSTRFHVEPRALSGAEIGELLDGYRVAARAAADGGLDGVELSASHGYLPAQFLSPASNQRDDAYNGVFDARLRFVREALAALREGAGPGLAVGVRLAADELTPHGLDQDACARIAAALAAEGLVDFVSLVLGHSSEHRASTWIAPPAPGSRMAIAAPARAIRAAVPARVPVIATTGVTELAEADALIRDGVADLVGMTRAHIADPDHIRKSVAGEPVIPCVGCNQACIGHYHAGTPIACVVNVRTGRENRLPRPEPAPPESTPCPVPAPPGSPRPESAPPGSRPESARQESACPARTAGGSWSVAAESGAAAGRDVRVVGGGPAGISAALEAARRGDRVRLFESGDELGGQFRVAGLAPAHAETWQRYRDWATAELDRIGVDVRVKHTATVEDCEGADLVVVASGALPYVPEGARPGAPAEALLNATADGARLGSRADVNQLNAPTNAAQPNTPTDAAQPRTPTNAAQPNTPTNAAQPSPDQATRLPPDHAAQPNTPTIAAQPSPDQAAHLPPDHGALLVAPAGEAAPTAPAGPVYVSGWDALVEPAGVIGPVLVADWGGGWEGLDVAEVLAARGEDVTLVTAAASAGETLHQYQRNAYLARLDLLGVRLRPHFALDTAAEGGPVLRHIFSGRVAPLPESAATVVLCQGRVPYDPLWQRLEAWPHAVRVGDAQGPRGLEEAIAEGALAVAR